MEPNAAGLSQNDGSNFSNSVQNCTVAASSRLPTDGAPSGTPNGDGAVRATVSVVLPVRNEARNLPYVAKRMPSVDEIIVIDGGSQDGTAEVARELWPDATVIEQTRSGRGNALACGLRAASADIIVVIDGDGACDPAEIPLFVDALVSGADLAKGGRSARGGGKRRDLLANRVVRTWLSGLCHGYNAFWRKNLNCLDLPDTELAEQQWGDGFEIDTMINLRAARSGWLVREVGSFEAARAHGRSDLAVTDGLRVLRTVGREQRRHRAVRAVSAGKTTELNTLTH